LLVQMLVQDELPMLLLQLKLLATLRLELPLKPSPHCLSKPAYQPPLPYLWEKLGVALAWEPTALN
jgi:hypothetical protein